MKNAPKVANFLIPLTCVLLSACASPNIEVPTFPATEYSHASAPTMKFSSLKDLNEKINGTIKYKTDSLTGFASWQLPYKTMQLKTGDCEDYAILKLALVRQNHLAHNAYMMAVFDMDSGQNHMLVVADDNVLDIQKVEGSTYYPLSKLTLRYKPIGRLL